MIEPYILQSDVEAARGHILELAARVEALLPRIEAAQGVHQEEALAKLANLYLHMAHELMKVGDLHGELIEDPRILTLRRAMKPWRGL